MVSFLRFRPPVSPFLSNPTLPRSILLHSHSLPSSNRCNVDDSVLLFNRMLQMRLTPSIIEFCKILTSLMKNNHYSTAISLSHKFHFTRITPDVVTLNILINCYCHLGQLTS